ncbi:MAG TPA: (d)CMP kinase [Anaerolineaceae bacterium]|nr:(d)CMP kinase [Anaerolineaceae bacterium]
MPIPKTIAIDGPAASGKSTLGCRLAKDLGYLYFDTGVMYRAVTLAALREGIPISDEEAVTTLANQVQIDIRPPSEADGRDSDVLINDQDISWAIRSDEVNDWVSPVSAYPGVRAAMTRQQRRIGQRGNVVMVGRDIGTVILPEADLKIYLDASPEERARRRYHEIIARGEQADPEEVLKSIRNRDQIDSTRSVAPLRPAQDAVIINSDHMSVEEVVQAVEDLFK